MTHTTNHRNTHGIVGKPRPQEQYFQESPFAIGQGIPGKTGPQERGEHKRSVTSSSDVIHSSLSITTSIPKDHIPHMEKSHSGFHTSHV